MKRPAFSAYLFGNPISILALIAVTAALTYFWWTAQGSGFLALIAGLGLAYGFKANDELEKYGQWKREWQAMEGKSARGIPGGLRIALRVIGAVVAFCFIVVVLVDTPDTLDMQVAKGLVVLALLIGIGGWIYRGAKALRARRRQRDSFRDVPVAVCIPAPRQATTLTGAYAAVPAYCAALLQRK